MWFHPVTGAFQRWFDRLTPEEFDRIWANRKHRKVITRRLLFKGGHHEWLVRSRANVFKRWGLKVRDIARLRSRIADVRFKNPKGLHGDFGSTTAHNEIIKIIDSSTSYEQFVRRLRNWAHYRLVGGADALPTGLK